MKETFEITETSRRLLQHLIEPLTLAQLNKIRMVLIIILFGM